MSLWSRLKNAVRPDGLDDELQDEAETHLALLEAEELKQGAAPEEARRRARLRFGNSAVYREQARDRDLFPWLANFTQDIRFTWRQLIHLPVFTLTTVLLLALGIGVNAAIFTLLNSVVLRSLPLPDPGRLVVMLEEMPGGGSSPPSWMDQKDFREQNRVFDSLAAFAYGGNFVMRTGTETSRVIGGSVTPDYFTTLGVTPLAGRIFTTDEARAGNDAVVLVREDFWRTAFNSDPNILSRQIQLNGRMCHIVGVMPRTFRFPFDTAVVWTPLAPTGAPATERGWHGFPMIGRLKPGVTLGRAKRELSAIMTRLSTDYPNADNDRTRVLLFPLQEWSVGSTRDRLVMLQYAAFAVFLMTCANVSSLLLARYSSRRREFALRSALGASTFRQVRQHLAESLMLASFGCLAGAGVAYAGVRFLLYLYDTTLPRAGEITVDSRLVLFTIGVTLAGAVVFGLITAFHSRSTALEQALREGGHSAGSRSGAFVRKALVIAQVACAITLVAGATELIRSFEKLAKTDSGLDTSNLLTMSVTLPESDYKSSQRVTHFFQDAVTRISALPGVKSAASINLLPVQGTGWNRSGIVVPGLEVDPHLRVELRWISGDYFRTMGIPLVRGRDFRPEEIGAKKPAIIINETMARMIWKDRDPIGWTVGSDDDGDTAAHVIGIARDVRQSGLQSPVQAEMFMALADQGMPLTEQSIVVRSALPAAALTPSIRREIRAVDANAAIYRVKSMDVVLADSVSYSRITSTLLGLFAALALLLAAFGLHGVMSYAVNERMREFAIRMAIGAKPAELARLVFGQSLLVVGIGVACGFAGVQLVTRLLPSALYGVKKVDAGSLVAAVSVLVMAALAALAAPAWRASRIDPIRLLRQD